MAAVEVPCGGKHWEAVVTPGRSCRRAGVHIGHRRVADSGKIQGNRNEQPDQTKSWAESLSQVIT